MERRFHPGSSPWFIDVSAERLGWTPTTTQEELVAELVATDQEEAAKESLLCRMGFAVVGSMENAPTNPAASGSVLRITPEDRIFVAVRRGMAGSATCRVLLRSGYGDPSRGGALLTTGQDALNLRDGRWVLAAARVGRIGANRSDPADVLHENLRIQSEVFVMAWRSGVRRQHGDNDHPPTATCCLP